MFNLFMEPFSAVKPGSFHLCPPRRQNQAEANAKQAKEEHKVLVVFGGVCWCLVVFRGTFPAGEIWRLNMLGVWFIMENQSINGWYGGTPISGNLQVF